MATTFSFEEAFQPPPNSTPQAQGAAAPDPVNHGTPNAMESGQQLAASVPNGPVAQGPDKVTGAIIPEANAQGAAQKAPATFSFEEAQQPAPGNDTATPATPATPVAPTAPADTKPERSVLGELGHQAGLAGRAAVNAVTGLPAMVADGLIVGPANLALSAYDKYRAPTASELVTGKQDGFRFKPQSQAVNNFMDAAGVAKPENATERVVQDVTTAMGGAGATMALGKALAASGGPLSRAAGKMLTEGPYTQLASAAASGAASGSVREAGGGEGAQLAAGVAGALLPGVPAAINSAARGALRGGEAGRQAVENTIKTFDDAAGTMPTLGQATGSKGQQMVETGLTNSVGGSSIMVRRAENQAKALGDSVQRLSNALAPEASGVDAGVAIANGAKAFRDNVKTTQQRLYEQLDNYIPPETRVTSARTQAALADLNTDIAGAPELSKWFKNARIQGIQGGLESDTGSIAAVLSRPGMKEQVAQMKSQLDADAARITAANAERRSLGMSNLEPVPTPAQIQAQIDGFLTKQIDTRLPYESIKKLRTLVGRELSDTSLASDVPRSKWRALYGALSDDLGDAAKNAGPKAEQVWGRANQYTKAAMQRMDELDTIVNRDTPEKVFKAATSGMADGGTTIRRVMRSMPTENRREVTAAVLQRLGKARNGLQNEAGDVFSSESFLTNLNAISPAARAALFDSSGIPGVGEKIAQMGRMSSVRREGSAVFANPSGTARQVALTAWMSGLFAALASGQTGAVATALALPIFANGLARTVANPGVVKFAAKSTALPAGMKAAGLGEALRANQRQEEPPPYVELRGMAEKPMNRLQAGRQAFKNGGVIEKVDGGFVVKNQPLAPVKIDQQAIESVANEQNAAPGTEATPAAPQGQAPAAVEGDAAAASGVPGAGAANLETNGLADPAHGAATSPLNDLPEPSVKQQKAGNYRVGRLKIAGMDISVENPEGSMRRGTDADGTPWETEMAGTHYGYLRGTRANDGDKLDVFVKTGTTPDYRGPVYVIDQVDPTTGRFDEHKAVIGADSEEDAEALYSANYAPDWLGLGAITKLPLPAFKAWAKSGKLKEPLGDIN